MAFEKAKPVPAEIVSAEEKALAIVHTGELVGCP